MTLQGHETWSVYRDDPVEHVLTLRDQDGSTHYECAVCRCRIWTRSDDALESFLQSHDDCAPSFQ